MKNNSKPLIFIPTSKNFSSFRTKSLDKNNSDEPLAYDVSDKGEFFDDVYSNLSGDSVLFKLLMELDDKEKIILLYQIIKEVGFNLTQEEFAKTLRCSRLWYSSSAKKVRMKCIKIIQSGQQ